MQVYKLNSTPKHQFQHQRPRNIIPEVRDKLGRLHMMFGSTSDTGHSSTCVPFHTAKPLDKLSCIQFKGEQFAVVRRYINHGRKTRIQSCNIRSDFHPMLISNDRTKRHLQSIITLASAYQSIQSCFQIPNSHFLIMTQTDKVQPIVRKFQPIDDSIMCSIGHSKPYSIFTR